MCGIIGIAGSEPCIEWLVDGLSRLEYRGYDSAGVMTREADGSVQIHKKPGRLFGLREAIQDTKLEGVLGIGHTRWATHGQPTEPNAHPHHTGEIVLVHNGIIDNFLELRAELAADGVTLYSDTDTEVLGHLIDRAIKANKGDIAQGIRAALGQVTGSFALAIFAHKDPDAIWFARHESPLVVGLCDDKNIVASDPLALLTHTRKVVYLEDGVFGRVSKGDVQYFSAETGDALEQAVHTLTWSGATVDKGPFKHYMMKEIHEQPDVVDATIDGLLTAEGNGPGATIFDVDEAMAKNAHRVLLLACGTSLHAAMVGRYYFERLAGIPAYPEQAGEWRSLGARSMPDTLTVTFSQSGETADTLSAIRSVKGSGSPIVSIINVPGSSIGRISDLVLHTNAGPEISVASTKAFTTQLAAVYLLAARIGLLRGHLDQKAYDEAVADLRNVVQPMRDMLHRESRAHHLATLLTKYNHALYLGRGILQPIAYEGALKLKEISYLHAEGYSAAEMKHGPIALIDEGMATVMLVPRGPGYAKALGNLQEIKARDGFVIGVVTEGDDRLSYHTDGTFPVPEVPELVQPLVTVMPLQLLAYHVADYRGTDIDKPRNLAKSVTVE